MPPWRFRCPEGHASVVLGRDRFRCHACGRYYDRERLQDLAG